MITHPLSPLFRPRSVAVVGASERPGSLGAALWQNVRSGGFRGPCYAVNPKYRRIDGEVSHASLADLPDAVDLAVIAAPAPAVPGILAAGARSQLRAAVVLSAGFRAKSASGTTLEQDLVSVAHAHGIRVLGPNCLGLTRADVGLNATFARARAIPGRVALVSQSGAICTAILDLAASEDFGFSSVISSGAAADVDFGEILDFLRQDSATEAILLYIEGIRDAASFMRALREAATVKPVIALKSGRYASGSKAASSHTGALVGRDEVFDTALRRCGAVRVMTYTQLIAAARTLSRARVPSGDRLAIVTNGGGLAVIAADSVMQNDVSLANLGDRTLAELDRVLPPEWSHANPVDIIGDASADRFRDAVTTTLGDDGVDALLTLYCPTAPADPVACARAVADSARTSEKPVLAVWLDSKERDSCAEVFEAAGIAHFASPEDAVEGFAVLETYRRNQDQLRNAPAPDSQAGSFDGSALRAAEELRRHAEAEGRTLLSEHEAKNLLRALGFPTAATILARDRGEAIAAARRIGFPVALKIHSPDISHKSDVGGVCLNLVDEAMVATEYERMLAHVRALRPGARLDGVAVQAMLRFEHAREVLIGVATDSIFGRVISFGAGGVAVEALRDTAIGLPPLNDPLARELMCDTRIHRVLGTYRNIPGVDMDALTGLLIKVSQLVVALPWLAELDLNPVLAHPLGVAIADARIVIAGPASGGAS
ncbi:MAG: acetate--CoA ligase family protein [Planctomycetota bacterium]